MIVVGPVKLTRQAAIVAGVGALTALVAAVVVLWAGARGYVPAGVVAPLLAFPAVYLATSLYGAYVTNCALVGHCVALSWLFVALFSFYAVLVPLYVVGLLGRINALSEGRW